MNLAIDLKQQALNLGATFFGIADISPAEEFIRHQGGKQAAAYPRAISIGIALQHSLVDPLPAHNDLVVIMNYRHLAYDAVNQRLDQISLHLSGMLQLAGYRARPVPASQSIDKERMIGFVSNKLAASLAGLGWIGKSCLLVTPEAGPRVRWATVLTTAMLEPTGQMIAPRCSDCRDCVNICPVQAFTGTNFNPAEPREVRFNARKCSDYLNWRESQKGYAVCGLCLYACPHGKSASRKLQ
jgi:epoxyqueuosine reductase